MGMNLWIYSSAFPSCFRNAFFLVSQWWVRSMCLPLRWRNWKNVCKGTGGLKMVSYIVPRYKGCFGWKETEGIGTSNFQISRIQHWEGRVKQLRVAGLGVLGAVRKAGLEGRTLGNLLKPYWTSLCSVCVQRKRTMSLQALSLSDQGTRNLRWLWTVP